MPPLPFDSFIPINKLRRTEVYELLPEDMHVNRNDSKRKLTHNDIVKRKLLKHLFWRFSRKDLKDKPIKATQKCEIDDARLV